jgi:hypothetical protein
MNIHNRPRTIYFARASTSITSPVTLLDDLLQSGQSLIEHSYKADSDLSPAGWEYAERLKQFVLERRAKTFEQKGLDPKDHRLVVRTLSAIFESGMSDTPLYRYGPRPAVERTTQPGRSSRHHKHIPARLLHQLMRRVKAI